MYPSPVLATTLLSLGGWAVAPAAPLQVSAYPLLALPFIAAYVFYVLIDRLAGREPASVEECPACGGTPSDDSFYCADCLSKSIERK